MVLRSTLPLFPSDDGWPYPDVDADAECVRAGMVVDDEVDLDALELRTRPALFAGLSGIERDALALRFGAGASLREVAQACGCSVAEAQGLLDHACAHLGHQLRVR